VREQDGVKRKPGRFRNAIKALATLSVALLLALASAEIGLRLFRPIPFHEWIIYQSDPYIGYRPEPGQEIRNRAGGLVRINRSGFRGPDYSLTPPPHTLRIAVFGGSAAFCFEASSRDASWPGALEALLRKNLKMNVEVVNLGLPGFTTYRSFQNYLHYGRSFHPDLVLIYHTWNDLKLFRYRNPLKGELKPYVPSLPLWQKIARSTQIGRYGRNFLWALEGRRMEGRFASPERQHREMPIPESQFDREARDFASFVDRARNDRSMVVLVSQAGMAAPENLGDAFIGNYLHDLAAMTGFLNMSVAQVVKAWQRISSIIEETASAHGALFIDGWAAVPHSPKYFRDHVHLEDEGSAALAQAIAQELLADSEFAKLAAAKRGL